MSREYKPWKGEQREFTLKFTPTTAICEQLHELKGTVKGSVEWLLAFVKSHSTWIDEELTSELDTATRQGHLEKVWAASDEVISSALGITVVEVAQKRAESRARTEKDGGQ